MDTNQLQSGHGDELLTLIPSTCTNFRVRSIEKSPLQIEELLTTIFSFLDPDTVKEARLVCTVWDREGCRNLLKNDRVILSVPHDLKQETLDQGDESSDHHLQCGLNRLLSHSSPLEPLRLRIRDERDVGIFLLNENRLLKNDNVKCLDFDGPSSSNMDTRQLANILENCKNLKNLNTTCLDLDPGQPWLQQLGDEKSLQNFIYRLSKLEKIGLNFWLNLSNFRSLTDTFIGHRLGVKSLQICSEPVLTLFVTEVDNLGWKIESLRLMIHNEMPIFVVRHFLRSVSPHLRHLRLSFFLRFQSTEEQIPELTEIDPAQIPMVPHHEPVEGEEAPPPSGPPPLMSHSHIPWTLTNLLTLDIYEDDHRLEGSVWKTVAVALRLPRLKKLVIRSSITGAFDEVLSQWTQHYPLRPIRSESLKKLVIWPRRMESASILFSNYCWPNLVTLVIKLEINQEVTGSAFLAIFTQLSSIRRLNLFLTDDHPPGQEGAGTVGTTVNFDQLLVGIERPESYLSGFVLSKELMERTQFRSIRNLQAKALSAPRGSIICIIDLKSLKLECVFCCEKHGWTDFFIYHGLLHLKNIQSVEMSGKFITQQAIEDMRTEFGPAVHIYFYEE